MDGVFIYEFLFRGGPTSSPDDDTWHVILAREVSDPFVENGTKLEVSPPLTPEQAAKLGFPLTRLLSELNQLGIEAAANARALRAIALAAEEERDAAIASATTARNELESIKAERATDKPDTATVNADVPVDTDTPPG